MPDKIKDAFEAIRDSKLFLDEADFRSQLQKDPRGVFDLFKEDDTTKDLFLDENDFTQVLGLKKNDSPSVHTPPSKGVSFGSETVLPYAGEPSPTPSTSNAPSPSESVKSDLFEFPVNKPDATQAVTIDQSKVSHDKPEATDYPTNIID